MCWLCCSTVRGAVYFSASIHIFLGIILLLRWIVYAVFLILAENGRIWDSSVMIRTLLSFLYVNLFLIIGCFIFRAVEKESRPLLKWSGSSLTILQSILFLIFLVLFFVSPTIVFIDEVSQSEPTDSIIQISTFLVSFIATVNYIVLIVLYYRKLRGDSKRGHSQTYNSLRSIKFKDNQFNPESRPGIHQPESLELLPTTSNNEYFISRRTTEPIYSSTYKSPQYSAYPNRQHGTLGPPYYRPIQSDPIYYSNKKRRPGSGVDTLAQDDEELSPIYDMHGNPQYQRQVYSAQRVVLYGPHSSKYYDGRYDVPATRREYN